MGLIAGISVCNQKTVIHVPVRVDDRLMFFIPIRTLHSAWDQFKKSGSFRTNANDFYI
ncbi:hypothetical protein Ethha_0577 [Ethanoligenens harbinense YUAN-3]|uniref:Uncharacterized protein n=1 Tax=Ethanoligenens harbinense (strain DSM 18485 / JCM 12961 / CGMCC 1.5033 / YUAN-3) TaxID=663278 RepID=E6U9G3_ETHHY|nr:hypothetical protein Ethha_0577 [Ethanoligenens harbinense YUAN-3]